MEKIPDMIPLSRFNRGYAGKILESIKERTEPTVIIKNNEPMAAIIPISRFSELIDAEELLKERKNG